VICSIDIAFSLGPGQDFIPVLLSEWRSLDTSAELLKTKGHETLTYYAFPTNPWRQLRANKPLERIIRETRRRTQVVGAFPDAHSALTRVAARLRLIASTKWGRRRYMAMENLLFRQDRR